MSGQPEKTKVLNCGDARLRPKNVANCFKKPPIDLPGLSVCQWHRNSHAWLTRYRFNQWPHTTTWRLIRGTFMYQIRDFSVRAWLFRQTGTGFGFSRRKEHDCAYPQTGTILGICNARSGEAHYRAIFLFGARREKRRLAPKSPVLAFMLGERSRPFR